jgi:hypothetical protein
MTTTTLKVATVAEHPAVIAATTEFAPVRAARLALEEERTELARMTGYRNLYSHEPHAAATPDAIAHARWRLPQVEAGLRELRPQEIACERRLAEAEAAAKAEIGAALRERYRVAVVALDKALTAAARASAAVAELDDLAEQALGTSAARLAWHELRAETPTEPSRLESWRRHAREHGVLV